MFWAIGAILLHVQAVPQTAVSTATAEKAVVAEALPSEQASVFEPGRLVLTPVADSSASPEPAAVPAAPPAAPAFAPAIAQGEKPAFAARINQGQQRKWLALAVAQHSAAVLDAWTTRRAITRIGAQELNPMLKPFAGNSSMYAATQVTPVLLDLLSRRMMTSNHLLLSRTWWLPQALGTVASFSGAVNNLLVH
jgi:hypothetical protein